MLHVLQVLACCEPLDLDTLSKIAGDDAVEAAETRALIRITNDHGISVRLNHPLFREVLRRQLGTAATRRLSGELVHALKQRPTTTPAERIRLAELTIDSDQPADVALLLTAARDAAVALTDITVGERLARAAVSRGGGPAASEVLARSLSWQGNAVAAEEALRPFQLDVLNDLDLVRWGLVQVANLQWSMGDAERAGEVLKTLRARVSDPELRLLVDGVGSATQLFENQLDQAVALSQRVLSDETASAAAVAWAVFGGALALALMGRGHEVAAMAERGHAIESRVDGLLRYLTAFGEVRALTLATSLPLRPTIHWICEDLVGRPVLGVEHGQRADQHRQPGPRPIRRHRHPDGADRCGIDIRIGRVVELPGTAAVLAQSYCVLGRVGAGAKMVAELRSRFGRHVAVFGPQLRIAEAWLAAAEGNVSSAIDLALDAAGRAEASGQRAIEMLALHDAVRFGDQSSLDRLIDIATGVDREVRGRRRQPRRGTARPGGQGDFGRRAPVRGDWRTVIGSRCRRAGGIRVRGVPRPAAQSGSRRDRPSPGRRMRRYPYARTGHRRAPAALDDA